MTDTNYRKHTKGYDITATSLAWIGHKSYIDHPVPSVSHMIFDTREEARRAGWKQPSRVLISLLEKLDD